MRWATRRRVFRPVLVDQEPYSVSSPKIRFSITIWSGRMRHARCRQTAAPPIHRDEARDISTTGALSLQQDGIQGFFRQRSSRTWSSNVALSGRLDASLTALSAETESAAASPHNVRGRLRQGTNGPCAEGHLNRLLQRGLFDSGLRVRYRPITRAWTSALAPNRPTGGSPQTCHHS